MKLYIGKDKDGQLSVFKKKPTRGEDRWEPSDVLHIGTVPNWIAPRLKWEDECLEIYMQTERDIYAVTFISSDGSVISHADTSRWDKLPRYKKIFGNVFKTYRRKFITSRPFSCTNKSDLDFL